MHSCRRHIECSKGNLALHEWLLSKTVYLWLMQITTIEKDILRMLSVLDLEELLVLFEGRCNGMRILLKVIVVKAANKIISEVHPVFFLSQTLTNT